MTKARTISLTTRTSVKQDFFDELFFKISQLKTLLLVGQDTDFSDYHRMIQEDFFGAMIEYIEDIAQKVQTVVA